MGSPVEAVVTAAIKTRMRDSNWWTGDGWPEGTAAAIVDALRAAGLAVVRPTGAWNALCACALCELARGEATEEALGGARSVARPRPHWGNGSDRLAK